MSKQFISATDVDRQELEGMGTLGLISPPTGSETVLFGDLVFQRGDGFPFHYHPNQDEALYIVSGSIEAWIEEDKRTIEAGDTMWLPRGTIHQCFNRSDSPAKMFVLLTPPIPDAEGGFELVDVSEEAPWNALS